MIGRNVSTWTLRACLKNPFVANQCEKSATEDAQERPRRRAFRHVEEPNAEDEGAGFRSRVQQNGFFKQALRALGCLLALGLSVTAPAHEGHDQPGAMPAAPHGGKVKEATGGTKKGSESELFVEAVYEEPKLKLYPLTMDDKGAFKAISPKKDLSNVSLEIELPRAGKRSKTSFTQTADSLEATVTTKGSNRFLVLLAVSHKGESKKARLQVEIK